MLYDILAGLASTILIICGVLSFINGYQELEQGENAFASIASGVFFLGVALVYFILAIFGYEVVGF